jgi:hypothetical protein
MSRKAFLLTNLIFTYVMCQTIKAAPAVARTLAVYNNILSDTTNLYSPVDVKRKMNPSSSSSLGLISPPNIVQNDIYFAVEVSTGKVGLAFTATKHIYANAVCKGSFMLQSNTSVSGE